MAEELEDLCRRLNLSEHEMQHTRLRKEKVVQSKLEAQNSLLFKLLTTCPFNGEALKGDMKPDEVSFKYAAFWIRIFNLPIKSMVKEVGEDIERAIGQHIEVDVLENGLAWGHYLRIRVNIDITKPLLRGKILVFDEGAPFWVDFRYEHLPIFCYRCGVLGHGMNECLYGRRSGESFTVNSDMYGQWLRAVPVRQRRFRESFPSDGEGDSRGGSVHRSGRREAEVHFAVDHPSRKARECVEAGVGVEKISEVGVLAKNPMGIHQGVPTFGLHKIQNVGPSHLSQHVGEVGSSKYSDKIDLKLGEDISPVTLSGGDLSGIQVEDMVFNVSHDHANESYVHGHRRAGVSHRFKWKKMVRAQMSTPRATVLVGQSSKLGKRSFAEVVEDNEDGSAEPSSKKGYGGGLALLWDSSLSIHVRSFSSHHFDAEVFLSNGLGWRLTGFYGHPEAALRARSWALLRRLHEGQDMPWVVLGDFNEITSLDEQWGRLDHNLVQMAAFRDVLIDCSLQDLGFFGPPFTWSNRRRDNALVRVRLDRGVANAGRLQLFPLMRVNHVVISSSDHLGLLFDMESIANGFGGQGRRRRPFRFNHSWVREVGCEEKIVKAWTLPQYGTAMYRVAKQVKACRVALLPATVDEVVSLVEQKVSPDMNDAMLAPFMVEEVKAALFQMNPSKAPGPDAPRVEGAVIPSWSGGANQGCDTGYSNLCDECFQVPCGFMCGNMFTGKSVLVGSKEVETFATSGVFGVQGLKAKYFPHSSVLEAVVPHNASFMWRSICESVVVLNSGLRWRVGTGSKIRIWKDAWLPGSTSNRVVSPPRVLDENATVDSFINWDSMCWNLDLIRQLFLVDVVLVIG
uniref:CCHC-type domain-containing protein n=1 Tax=Fagus sylvatica TaxID=28930 RepID=A0A2N9G189_FAGSY